MCANSRIRIKSILTAIALFSFFALNLTIAWRTHAMKEQPYGRYTREQIVDRTAPLCRVVAPETGNLLFSAEPNLIHLADGDHRQWNVDCTDGAGNQVAHFLWDADMGDLVAVGHEPSGSSQNVASQSLTDRQAFQRGLRLLYFLEISPPKCVWREDGTPERRGRNWCMEFEADGRSASVMIDAGTGDVRLIQIHGARPAR